MNAKLAKGTFRPVQGTSVATTIEPATDYYLAEDYHQQVWADCVNRVDVVILHCMGVCAHETAARNIANPDHLQVYPFVRSTWPGAAGMGGRRTRTRARRIESGATARRLNSCAVFYYTCTRIYSNGATVGCKVGCKISPQTIAVPRALIAVLKSCDKCPHRRVVTRGSEDTSL